MRKSKKRFWWTDTDDKIHHVKCGRVIATTSGGDVRQAMKGRHPWTVKICGCRYLMGALVVDDYIRTIHFIGELKEWDTNRPFDIDDGYDEYGVFNWEI